MKYEDTSAQEVVDLMMRMERSLKDKESQLHALNERARDLNELPIAAVWTDADLRITRTEGIVVREMDGQFGSFAGRPVEEMLQTLYPCDNAADGMSRYHDMMRGRSITWTRMLYGRILRCYGEPHLDSSGNIIGTRVVGVDETNYQRTGEDPVQSEDDLPICCWLTNEELVIQSVAGQVIRDFIKELGETIVGMHVEEAYRRMGVLDIESMCSPFHRALKGDKYFYDFALGGHEFRTYISPLVTAEGTIVGTRKLSKEITHVALVDR